MDPLLEAAFKWHRAGRIGAPDAGSVVMTQAIIDELNTAVRLLGGLPDPPDAVRHFLAKHAGAPYG
jgi:hypothetical protein